MRWIKSWLLFWALLAVSLSGVLSYAWADQTKNLKKIQNEIQQLKNEEKKTNRYLNEAETALKKQSQHLSSLYQKANSLGKKAAYNNRKLIDLQKKMKLAEKKIQSLQKRFSKTVTSSLIITKQGENHLFLLKPNKRAARYLYQRLLLAQTDLIQDLSKDFESHQKDKVALEKQNSAVKNAVLEAKKNLKELEGARKKQKTALQKLDKRLSSVKLKRAKKEREAKELASLLQQIKRGDTNNYNLGGISFQKSKGKLPMPVKGKIIRAFGYRESKDLPALKGVVIRTQRGSLVRATQKGRVAYADYLTGFGYLVILRHSGNYLTLYGYNDSVLVRKDQNINPGDSIAYSGNEAETGESVYFGIRHRGKDLDPKRYFAK